MHEPQTAARGQPTCRDRVSLIDGIRLAGRSIIDRAVPGAVVETRYYTVRKLTDVAISDKTDCAGVRFALTETPSEA